MPRYRIDLHGHCQGDPVDALDYTVFEYIDRAVACGLNAVAITWHGKVFDDAAGIAYAQERGVLLIPGVEADLMGRMHTLILNVTPGQVPENPTLEQLREIRKDPSVLVVAPHPYFLLPNCLGRTIDRYPDCFDAVEWSRLNLSFIPGFLNPNTYARRWATRHGKALLATSDAHKLGALGDNVSVVEADELSCEAIFAAIRANRVSCEPFHLTLREFLWLLALVMGENPLQKKAKREELEGKMESPARAPSPAAAPRPASETKA